MGIQHMKIPEHWNYFLILEADVQSVSRWIAFTRSNESAYSIELARLLMTAAAEVDVVAKALCKKIQTNSRASSINAYQALLMAHANHIADTKVKLPQYGMTLHPWKSWKTDNNPPLWWQGNNKVKHHRDEHFEQANLKNVLNAVAGLLVLLLIYYKYDKRDYLTPIPKIFVPNTFATVEAQSLRLLSPDNS